MLAPCQLRRNEAEKLFLFEKKHNIYVILFMTDDLLRDFSIII